LAYYKLKVRSFIASRRIMSIHQPECVVYVCQHGYWFLNMKHLQVILIQWHLLFILSFTF